MYKSKVEDIIKLKLNCCLDDNIFQEIHNNLIYMDYYKHYEKKGGFLKELEQRHLYLPYMINYLRNRCARIFLYCVIMILLIALMEDLFL